MYTRLILLMKKIFSAGLIVRILNIRVGNIFSLLLFFFSANRSSLLLTRDIYIFLNSYLAAYIHTYIHTYVHMYCGSWGFLVDWFVSRSQYFYTYDE